MTIRPPGRTIFDETNEIAIMCSGCAGPGRGAVTPQYRQDDDEKMKTAWPSDDLHRTGG
jgi:hypothetical protein